MANGKCQLFCGELPVLTFQLKDEVTGRIAKEFLRAEPQAERRPVVGGNGRYNAEISGAAVDPKNAAREG